MAKKYGSIENAFNQTKKQQGLTEIAPGKYATESEIKEMQKVKNKQVMPTDQQEVPEGQAEPQPTVKKKPIGKIPSGLIKALITAKGGKL